MTLDQAKIEAWKNQNPIITKVDDHDEYVWFPEEFYNSQQNEFAIMSVTPILRWSTQDKMWKKI